MKNRIRFTVTTLALLILGLAGEAVAQVASTCNADDIFVDNLNDGKVLRFSKADIAVNGNASTSTVIGSGNGPVEGMTLDFDGTVIVAARANNTVYRFDRTGTPSCVIATILRNEGPSFDAAGNLFINDNLSPITYKAAPVGGCPNMLSPVAWINTYPGGTFTEDTRISPSNALMFPNSLYILLSVAPFTNNPNGIQAWSATTANTLLGTVISDFGTAAGLGAGAYRSLGMTVDSQGDIWVCDYSTGVGAGRLLEFNSAGAFQRMVTMPGSSQHQVKIAISAPNPSDPLNPNRNTLYVTDEGTNSLYILDEVTGTVLFTLTSNLNNPAGVAVCDVIVQPPPSSLGFVIGDRNAVVGNHVMFWGAQWWKHNSLSGGPAPASFKGFANSPNPNPPACGGTWQSRTGNSSGPPDSVPADIVVIVSSSITKSGSVISGDVPEMAIVHTAPGYDGNPGHAGTGTVTAVFCPP